MEIEQLLFYEMDRFYMAVINNTICLQGHPLQILLSGSNSENQ